MESYRLLSLADEETLRVVEGTIEWIPLRRRIGAAAFGTNAYRAARAGDDVIEDHRLPIRGDDPRYLYRRKIFSVTRVDDGYLYVILGGEQHESAMSHIRASWILQQSMILAVAALVFALVAGLVLFGAMTRRLRNLATAVESTTDGMKLPVNGSGDEVDRLALETFENVELRDPQLFDRAIAFHYCYLIAYRQFSGEDSTDSQAPDVIVVIKISHQQLK